MWPKVTADNPQTAEEIPKPKPDTGKGLNPEIPGGGCGSSAKIPIGLAASDSHSTLPLAYAVPLIKPRPSKLKSTDMHSNLNF